MNCKLCLQPATLRRSHIIPEFLHKDVYNEDHTARALRADSPYVRRLRKGLRERLLCDGCERVLQRNEDYFARAWYDQGALPRSVPAGTDAAEKPVLRESKRREDPRLTLVPGSRGKLVITGLDYRAFKLFHLSILWRASVAALEEFRDTKLGPHEDVIRRMLLAGDPGPADRYRLRGCLILRPGTRTVLRTLIGAPGPSRLDDHWIYSMIYGGCLWNLVVSSHGAVGLDELTFSETGRLVLPAVDLTELRYVSALASRR